MTNYSLAPRRGLSSGRGGLFALSWPLVTIAIALVSMRSGVTGLTDPSTPIVAGMLFLLAAPTTWLFAWLDLAPVLAVGLGVVTSLPIWFFVGGRIAAASWTWGEYLRRYVAIVLGWAVLAIVLLAVFASLSS